MSGAEQAEHAALLALLRAVMASPADPAAARSLIEVATFASAAALTSALDRAIGEDFLGVPPWARNLVFRLACLQSPDDADLRRRAANDLRAFGPDWDAEADRLDREADALEGGEGDRGG